MFFYLPVLKRHSGCFSTIWLVATNGIRVPRRDFLKVNVENTCDDIMNYVLEQVSPPRPGLPRPRFSLYLSSQLQYGVVRVYHRQCAILLEELQAFMVQLAKQRTSHKIDMEEHNRTALDFPDALSLQEETEGALDPLFGVMHMQYATPSPNTLIQMGLEYPRETSHKPAESTSPAAAAAAIESSDITASPDMITLRETEPVTIPAAEFEGMELVHQLPETLDFLLAQTDHFPEGDLEMQRDEVRPGEEEREKERKEQERDFERERDKEITGSTTDLQPTTLSSEDAVLFPQEEPGLSVERPEPPIDQLTPASVPLPTQPSAAKKHRRPTTEVEVVPPPEVKTRKRRKRQLIFLDPETQLSQEVLQQQIDNPLIETRSPVLPLPFSPRMLPAAELLNLPCTILPEEVRVLWREAASVTPISGFSLLVGGRGPESSDSEKDREREASEVSEREEERCELISKEVPRGPAESEMLAISDLEILSLEGSGQKEVSREISPMFTPEGERSPISRSVSILQDIPEVLDEVLGRAEAVSHGLQLELPEHNVAPLLFKSLLSPKADRRSVSNLFQRLLEKLSARRLRVEQDEPYGDILILPGPGHEEVHLTL